MSQTPRGASSRPNSSNPSDRALVARIAAHELWSQIDDRAAFTAPARTAFLDRFERQVDPDGTMASDERARRAEHARKAYFTRLALRSAQSRRRAAEARVAAVQLDLDAEVAEAQLAQANGGDAA